MASVTLTEGWLSLASDLTLSVTAPSSVDETDSRPVEVRRYANGRLRAVSRAGRQRVLKVTLHRLASVDVETVRGWVGSVVLFRDPFGRKVYGVFDSISPEPYLAGVTKVELTLTEVTVSEAV